MEKLKNDLSKSLDIHPVVTEIQKLSLKKDDILIMKLNNSKVNALTLKTLKKNMDTILKSNGYDNTFLIFNGEMEFKVVENSNESRTTQANN